MSKVTVLMTTYNEIIDVLQISLESILRQTLSDFEILIIIDNPNRGDIIALIENYKFKDRRVSSIINKENLGLPIALNRGIDLINSEYIARMDADDIAENNRLEMQLNFLEKHPEISMIGTNTIQMSKAGTDLYKNHSIPLKHSTIACTMKYGNIFTHPSLMVRTKVYKDVKYRDLRYSQDYDFECRLIEKGYKVANIPDYCIHYRINDDIVDEKIVRTFLATKYIKYGYKAKKLSLMNISQMIDEEYQKTDVNKKAAEIKKIETSFRLLHKKRYFHFIWFILKNSATSDYFWRQTFCRLMIRLTKAIYR